VRGEQQERDRSEDTETGRGNARPQAIAHDELVSIIFTATDDLTEEFPATAARALGLGDVPSLRP
jgi:chorismate mutase